MLNYGLERLSKRFQLSLPDTCLLPAYVKPHCCYAMMPDDVHTDEYLAPCTLVPRGLQCLWTLKHSYNSATQGLTPTILRALKSTQKVLSSGYNITRSITLYKRSKRLKHQMYTPKGATVLTISNILVLRLKHTVSS